MLQIVVLEKTPESPWTAKRANPSILKEINPESSLEELMLKLKLQYTHTCKKVEPPLFCLLIKINLQDIDFDTGCFWHSREISLQSWLCYHSLGWETIRKLTEWGARGPKLELGSMTIRFCGLGFNSFFLPRPHCFVVVVVVVVEGKGLDC